MNYEPNLHPQVLVEHVEDTIAAGEPGSIDGKVQFLIEVIKQALVAAFELGQREEAAANLEANELVMEAMEKSINDRNFNAADLVAFMLLLSEYGGTEAEQNGRIFTTLDIAAMGERLRGYECAKFYLPNGLVEYQINRKIGGQHQIPSPESET